MLTNILNKKNIVNLLPYLGIFFVLLMGSGLVKIPIGSAWFYIIKFGIIAAVMGIGVSAWWKAKKNNEPPIDYLKLALFVPFTIDFHLHYAFIFLTIILFNKKLLLPWNSPLKPIYLLFIWGFISYIINQFVEFNPLSFPLFVIVFFTPWIFFGLAYKNVNKDNLQQIIKHYFNIIMIMIGIIALQTIIYWKEHPDYRNGGVKDPHFAAIYLSVVFFLFISNFYIKNSLLGIHKYLQYAILIFTIPILYLIDAKYVLLFVLFISVFTFFIFGKLKWYYKSVTLFIILLSVLTWLNYTNRSLPISATSLTHGSYTLNGIIEHFPKTPKGQLIKDGLDLPKKEPLVFIFGSGPGTFLSVAANSRTPKDTLKVMMAYTRESVRISSKLPDFIKPFTTWIKYKYGKSYLLFKDYGSTIYDWGGSFLNIYFEMGIIGLAIIFWFFYYLARLITKIDYKHKTFMISTVVLFFMINFIASWLDQQNFMIFQSILFATFLKTTNTKF